MKKAYVREFNWFEKFYLRLKLPNLKKYRRKNNYERNSNYRAVTKNN